MKLRIKANSIRIRLNKSEVTTFSRDGYLEEQTLFGENKFVYALQSIDNGKELSAKLENNKVTMLVPAGFLKDWPANNVVGFNSNMPATETDSLFLLLEKDFICLDETSEDQSDNYENPNKTC